MAKTIDKEKELLSIMKDAECTREEAEEIFKIEENVRKNGKVKIGATSETPRKKTTRERKPDADKQEIIQCVDDALCDLVDNVEMVNPEREIRFVFNDAEYSVTLTKHRPPKKKGD